MVDDPWVSLWLVVFYWSLGGLLQAIGKIIQLHILRFSSKCGCHLLHLFWSSTNVDIPKTCYTSSILQPNWWEFTNSKCSKLHEPIKVLSYSIILFWCLSFNNDDWILILISLNSCNGLVKCIMERRTYIMIQLINKWLTENSTTNGAKMKPSTLISWSLWSPCAIPIRFKLDSSSYS